MKVFQTTDLRNVILMGHGDSGKTTLYSAVFDAAGLANPKVSYFRWFHNSAGGNPNEDVLEVSISNDGGATCTLVETVGPAGPETSGGWIEHEFDVAPLVTPTANMMLRFVASDLNGGSIVEAAIDDVLGEDLAPIGGCPNQAVSVCQTAPNSAGSGATIAVTGTAQVGQNSFGLKVSGLPAGQSGIFFYGANPGFRPLGDGFFCLSGRIMRFPLITIGGSGEVTQAVDFTSLPGGMAGQIMAGSTWYFQFWYTDPAAGMSGVNLSDSIEVPFCN